MRGTKGSFYLHKSETPPVGQKSRKVLTTSGNTYCSSGTPGKQSRLPEPARPGSTSPMPFGQGLARSRWGWAPLSGPCPPLFQGGSLLPFPATAATAEKAKAQPGRWLKLPASSAKWPQSPPSSCTHPLATLLTPQPTPQQWGKPWTGQPVLSSIAQWLCSSSLSTSLYPAWCDAPIPRNPRTPPAAGEPQERQSQAPRESADRERQAAHAARD